MKDTARQTAALDIAQRAAANAARARQEAATTEGRKSKQALAEARFFDEQAAKWLKNADAQEA